MMLCLAPPAHAVPQRPCDPHLQDLGEARIENYEALSGASYTVQLKLRLDNHGTRPVLGSSASRRTIVKVSVRAERCLAVLLYRR